MSNVTRPLLRYHGGKWRLAKWIISHFPKHQIYVEPFGGAASVLLQKDRSYTEVYNDLDKEVVNLFRVLQDRSSYEDLRHRVQFTPYSREQFELAHLPTVDSTEQARRTLVRSWFGIGGGAFLRKQRTGFRAGNKIRGTQPQHDWEKWKSVLDLIVDRLKGVVIECQDATKVIKRNDTARTLFYVDPPYVRSTRSKSWGSAAYNHELTDDDHQQLGELLNGVEGMTIVSGYDNDIYREVFAGWTMVGKGAVADGHVHGHKHRTEVLWLSPNIHHNQLTIFDD